MAAEVVPYPVMDLAEGHKMQRVLLSRYTRAPPALARVPPHGRRRPEHALRRARPGRVATQFPDGFGEDLGDPRQPGHLGQPQQTLNRVCITEETR